MRTILEPNYPYTSTAFLHLHSNFRFVICFIYSTGKVGITLNIGWGEPADNTTSSADAAERSIQFAGGWFANPIWGATGGYPQVMIDKVHSIFHY